MKNRSETTSLELERLRERAIRKNKKARRILKKINREIVKKSPNLRQVLQWQDKASKLLRQGLKMMEKRSVLKQPDSDQPKTVHFKLEKVSEKFVKKFGAVSCVYRATMEEPNDDFKVKDILDELDDLFTKSIEKVAENLQSV